MNLCNKYGFKNSTKLRSYSVQEVVDNENAEIRVETQIKADIKIKHNRLYLFNIRRKEKIILIEVGITISIL